MDKERRYLVVIAMLVALLAWETRALARVENQRYAMSTGMCASEAPVTIPDWRCLQDVETRAGWYWHVFYALTN